MSLLNNIRLKREIEVHPKYLDSNVHKNLNTDQFIGTISNAGIIICIGDIISIQNKIVGERVIFTIEFDTTIAKPTVGLRLDIKITEIIEKETNIFNSYGFLYDKQISFCVENVNLLNENVNVIIKYVSYSQQKFNCIVELAN